MSAGAAGDAAKVILLRGVNLGTSNRIAMPRLRQALTDAGLENARTHLQSGNILASTSLGADELSTIVARVIREQFELSVPVLTRTAGELAAVVAQNPFPQAAALNPKRYQVTFFSEPLAAEAQCRVRALSDGAFSADTEAVSLAISNRHAYGWHPDGIHRSRLARGLSDDRLGVVATARNWTTVTTLLEIATSDGT